MQSHLFVFYLWFIAVNEIWGTFVVSASERKYERSRKLNEEMDTQLFNNTDFVQNKRCRTMRRAHKVKPGVSWGTMNREQQDLWIKLNCDQFFCKPHQLAGKGIYKCISLEPTEKIEV